MNKTLALIAILGLISAPVMANETPAPAKAEKVVAKDEMKKEGDAKAADAQGHGDHKAEDKKEEKKH